MMSARTVCKHTDLSDATPLDYSFKKLESLADMFTDKPRESRVGKLPDRASSKKFLTRAVWLDNNNLSSLYGVDQFITRVLEIPDALSWIDFSFNHIKDITSDILKFPNLIIMYLHGNEVDEIENVFKLRKLKKLKRLTLHGNPISELPGYRNTIVHVIPQLYNLDFAPVVKDEKNFPAPIGLQKKLDNA